MNKQIAIIADKLSLPIDEGLKKLAFKMMEYGLSRKDIDVYNSPENLGIKDITVYRANKLMISSEIKSLLNKKKYTDIYYIPEASTTFNTFVRAWIIHLQAPRWAKVHIISSQKRKIEGWQKKFLNLIGKQHVITFSRSANNYIRELGFHSTLYPLAVDGNVFKPVTISERVILRGKYGINTDARVALHVGHIRKSRNISVLKRLADNGWQVVVVGSTSMAYEEDVAEDLKAHGIIIRGEFNPRVEELYQLADLYVFPVRNENAAIDFPLSVLEAMACELPVISTRFGALPDNFEETNSFGYFDRDENLCAIADKFYGVDASENRRLVMNRFSWNMIFEKIIGF